MSREIYRAVDEPAEYLTGDRAIERLTAALERWELRRINLAVNAIRRQLKGSRVDFPLGFASIIQNGTGLTAYMGRDTSEYGEGSVMVDVSAGWDEDGIVGDVAIVRQETEGGQIVDEVRFGAGQSSPEYSGLPNTLPASTARMELNLIRDGVRGAIRKSRRTELD